MVLLNPQKAFRYCIGLIDKSWKTPALYQKMSVIPIAFFTIVLAIPAAVQYVLQKTIIEPLQKTTNERAVLLNNQVTSSPIISKVNHLNMNLIEIDDPDPVSALTTLQSLLQTHPDKIPVFSIKTQQAVNQYLKEMNQLGSPCKTTNTDEIPIQQLFAKNHLSEIPLQNIEKENHHRKPAALNAFKPQQKLSDVSTESPTNVASPNPARRPS